MNVSTEQQAAILHRSGPAMVIAGPGSGKTSVITGHIRALTEEQGVDPAHILVITYTRAAADSMKRRYLGLCAAPSSPVTFGTFHAVFYRILRQSCHLRPDSVLRPEKRREWLLMLLADRAEAQDREELLTGLVQEIAAVKGRQLRPEDYVPQCCTPDLFQYVFREYEALLAQEGLLDFEDMLVRCRELFEQRPDILATWQAQFTHILVDEFQDINPLQYTVVRMLALPENNLFIVGDDDQSIYRFRGSEPGIMLHFPQDYPGAAVYPLSTCYRCSPQILSAAGRLIARNTQRFAKTLRSAAPGGPEPKLRAFAGREQEQAELIAYIRELHTRGLAYREMAVLYRTNYEAEGPAAALARAGIPFRVKESLTNLYETPVARDVLAYLRLARGPLTRGDLTRVMNKPLRYLSRRAMPQESVSFAGLAAYYRDQPWMLRQLRQLEAELKTLSQMRPFAAIQYLRRGMGYEDWLRQDAGQAGRSPEKALEQLDRLQEESAEFPELASWEEHIRSYGLLLGRLNRQENGADDADELTLSTMHGAKGLEYTAVFLPGLNEGTLPHKRAERPEELEEERRLLYVAMTRARSFLWMSRLTHRRGELLPASRFLAELGLPLS